ncbi:MAG: hypothetical protein ACJ8R9_17665 [Steroidobacteraceae bacterium]
MERSVEEYSLHEPFGVPHDHESDTGSLSEAAHPELPPDCPADLRPQSGHWQPEDLPAIRANPFTADEPHPAVVTTVKRFGVVGLVVCALGAGLTRWWKSLAR